MTKKEFDDFIVLHDTFEDKCALVASIFGEVVEDFKNVNNWGIDPPFTTCTGYREPGYVYSISPTPRFLCVPFKYIQMTEDELKDIAKNHPEQIKAMVNTDAEQENEEAEEFNELRKDFPFIAKKTAYDFQLDGIKISDIVGDPSSAGVEVFKGDMHISFTCSIQTNEVYDTTVEYFTMDIRNDRGYVNGKNFNRVWNFYMKFKELMDNTKNWYEDLNRKVEYVNKHKRRFG